MKQLDALCKRLLLAFALSLSVVALCAAQTPVTTNGNAQQQQPAAAPGNDKSAAQPTSATGNALDAELAETPAGKTVAKFFAAFNSGDLKQMRAFHESFGGEAENADKDFDFYEQTGGLKLHSLTRPATDKLAVLVQTKKDARWIIFEFGVKAEAPHAINSIKVRPSTAPTK